MDRRRGLLALSLVAGVLAAGAALAGTDPRLVIETGEATWYGGAHAGHRTASGARFDPTRMTAAHRNIPIGTHVRVTDLSTGRSIVVEVNDREPPHGVRCIDLSEGAARALGIRNQGIADVEIASIGPNDAASADPVEVADAPDDAQAPDAQTLDGEQVPVAAHATRRHGRRHKPHAAP